MDGGSIWSIVLTGLTLVVALGLAYRPLGDHIARIYTGERDLAVERGTYRLIGVDARSAQTWQAYLRSVLLFSFVSVVFVYALMRLQPLLPFALGLEAPSEALSFNTAVSFVTNTNWQSYSGETTLGYTVQFAALTVQNFVSAAVGIAIAMALVRGFAYRRSGVIGNFWVDLVRGTYRLLLPFSIVAALVLLAGGVIQKPQRLHGCHDPGRGGAGDPGWAGGIPGGHQAARDQRRRLLQRQLRPSVREPDAVDQPLRDLPDAGHPVLAAPRLRPHRGR